VAPAACCWLQEAGKRPAGSAMNINHALDKAFEKHSLKDLISAAPSALQGLAEWCAGCGGWGVCRAWCAVLMLWSVPCV
jgi:hypothetical protein